MAGRDAWRSRIVTGVKYGVGIAALGWVVHSADVDRILATLGQLSVQTLLLVVALSVIGVLARVATWYSLAAYFTPVDVSRLVTADLIIKFVNSLFPSRLSGRSVAPLALQHFVDLEWNEAVAVTVAHTGLYAVLYGAVTLLGFAIDADSYGPGLTTVILLSAGAYVAVGCTIVLSGWRLDLFDRLVYRVGRAIERIPGGGRVASPLDGLRAKLLDGSDRQFQQLVTDGRTVALFAGTWVGALLVVPALRVWILLSATGVTNIDPLLLPLYLIVGYSITILPLTPGGIGVTEATAVAVFVALGVPEGAIVTVVFLDRIFGVYLPSIAGWVPLIRTDFESVVG